MASWTWDEEWETQMFSLGRKPLEIKSLHEKNNLLAMKFFTEMDGGFWTINALPQPAHILLQTSIQVHIFSYISLGVTTNQIEDG